MFTEKYFESILFEVGKIYLKKITLLIGAIIMFGT